jgi:hypothetical protein
MRIKINKATAQKLNRRGKALGMVVVTKVSSTTFIVRVTGTSKTLIVGV